MKFSETIGIDVSKSWIDARMHLARQESRFDNTIGGYKKLIAWVEKSLVTPKESILFAFEHTGLYSYGLSCFLSSTGYYFTLIPGLELHRSMGIVRGKEDRIDATKIALYAYRRKDEIVPYQMPARIIDQLRHLLSLRNRLVVQRAGYQASLKENTLFLQKNQDPDSFQIHDRMIHYLSKQIERIILKLIHTIQKDQNINHLFEMICSIKGVGPQTAYYMIVLTHGFILFSEWRKFASYAGTAPFPYQSGTSIKGKTKVNHLANKKIKSLLHSCALSAILYNPEMKAYYNRRSESGKSKMSTLNIIRNKILARIFAVATRGTPYVDTHKYAAA
ncbi:MAG: transposase [Bacteroidales bacterium]|nr:transposase [Bacteroidales bacterium]